MATKKTSRSGFDAPTIGTIHQKGATVKVLPNGRIEIVEPKKKNANKKKGK